MGEWRVPGLDAIDGVVLEGVFLDVGFVDEGVEQDAQDLDSDDGHERRQGHDTEAAHIAIILRITVFCVFVLALFYTHDTTNDTTRACKNHRTRTHRTRTTDRTHDTTRTTTHTSHVWYDLRVVYVCWHEPMVVAGFPAKTDLAEATPMPTASTIGTVTAPHKHKAVRQDHQVRGGDATGRSSAPGPVVIAPQSQARPMSGRSSSLKCNTMLSTVERDGKSSARVCGVCV
jgi:hypothetical protein